MTSAPLIDAAERLRGAGLRVTEPRRAVVEALHERAHASAEELYAVVARSLPATSLQSVYNALGDFVDAGLVRRIEPAGRPGLFELRVADNHHHLVCSVCGAVEDVVRGLDAGADDYLSKPFKFDELLARIRALQRRGGAERLEVLRYGPIALDRLRHSATINDARLDLTPKEFQLLEHFLLHPEEVVRRTTLLEKVWDMQFDPESNVVYGHVGNLRRKVA